MNEPIETSLSKLSNHDWQIITHRWGRGIDWNIFKLGKHWQIAESISTGFPLFKTKKAAYAAAEKLILLEAQHRYWVEHEKPTA